GGGDDARHAGAPAAARHLPGRLDGRRYGVRLGARCGDPLGRAIRWVCEAHCRMRALGRFHCACRKSAGESKAAKQAGWPHTKLTCASAQLSLANEILPVGRGLHRLGKTQQLFRVDKTLVEGDFLRTGDLQALPFLDDVDELRRFQQRVMGAGIEPGIAAAKPLDVKVAASKIPLVEVSDLELSAGGGL